MCFLILFEFLLAFMGTFCLFGTFFYLLLVLFCSLLIILLFMRFLFCVFWRFFSLKNFAFQLLQFYKAKAGIKALYWNLTINIWICNPSTGTIFKHKYPNFQIVQNLYKSPNFQKVFVIFCHERDINLTFKFIGYKVTFDMKKVSKYSFYSFYISSNTNYFCRNNKKYTQFGSLIVQQI